jgi:hypothetical protein
MVSSEAFEGHRQRHGWALQHFDAMAHKVHPDCSDQRRHEPTPMQSGMVDQTVAMIGAALV